MLTCAGSFWRKITDLEDGICTLVLILVWRVQSPCRHTVKLLCIGSPWVTTEIVCLTRNPMPSTVIHTQTDLESSQDCFTGWKERVFFLKIKTACLHEEQVLGLVQLKCTRIDVKVGYMGTFTGWWLGIELLTLKELESNMIYLFFKIRISAAIVGNVSAGGPTLKLEDSRKREERF